MGRRERGEGKRGWQFISPRIYEWALVVHIPPTHSSSEKILENVFCEVKDCFVPLNRHVISCLTPTGLPCAVSQSGVYCSESVWEFVFTARYICSLCAFWFSWGQLLMNVSDIWSVKLGLNFIIDFAFLLDTNNANNFLCQSDWSVFTQREAAGQELGWQKWNKGGNSKKFFMLFYM